MTSPELERLADRGLLKREPPVAAQVAALVTAGEEQLRDAATPRLSTRSRFQLAYSAAYALASAALRRAGYRSDNRYLAFQTLELTLAIGAPTWRVLARAHQLRNQMEYEGTGQPDQRLVADTMAAARTVLGALRAATQGE